MEAATTGVSGLARERMTAQRGFPYDGFPLAYVACLLGEEGARTAFASIGNPAAPGAPQTLDFAGTWKVMAANMRAVGDESHGAANPGAPIGNFEMMCDAMLKGEHLAGGLGRMARFSRVMRTDMQIDARNVRGALHVSGVSRSDLTLAREAYTDAFALVLHFAICWATGSFVAPVRVQSSSHMACGPGSALGLIYPSVEWRDQGFLLAYGPQTANASFVQRDAEGWLDGAYREFLKLRDGRLTGARPVQARPYLTEGRVKGALIERPAKQGDVARRLNMSVATLRRRLQAEGTSFRAIADGIRRDAAEILLATDSSSHEIASHIGLSDSRCFRRSCKSWFGRSPSEARQALGSGKALMASPVRRP